MNVTAIPDSVLSHPQVVAAFISASGTLLAAILVGIVGTFLTKWFARARDEQDRESQWRSHAVELTKLDIQRKLGARVDGDPPLRPAVLDFLANYRDLQELGKKSPKELYLKILADRISPPLTEGSSAPASPSARGTGEAPAAISGANDAPQGAPGRGAP